MRYKCIISYDGSFYNGFQRQDNLPSVQETIETCLTKIFKETMIIHGAGRTDAFVHAKGQVIHFDNESVVPEKNLAKIMNKLLYPHIYVKRVEHVDHTFHCRKDALSKEYRYFVNIGEFDPTLANYQLFFHPKLDFDNMVEAMNLLIGTHDFKTFAKANSKVYTVRTVYTFELRKTDNLIEFRVVGNGFLRHMVRIMIAVVLKVGEGKFKPDDVLRMLEDKDRLSAPYIARAVGLYLWEVKY